MSQSMSTSESDTASANFLCAHAQRREWVTRVCVQHWTLRTCFTGQKQAFDKKMATAMKKAEERATTNAAEEDGSESDEEEDDDDEAGGD